MSFSVIIVTHNSQQDIERCILSIKKCNGIDEIIIVDNGSKDNTIDIIRKLNRYIDKLHLNNKNLGYGAACNQGASRSKGKYLFFCNPDIEVLNDVFPLAETHFENNLIGCVGPQLLNNDGSESPFAFRFPHSPTVLAISYLRNKIGLGNPEVLQLNRQTNSLIIKCDWILGAAFFLPKAIFDEVNGFDENFFLYFEEIDLCKRIKKKGYNIISDRKMKIKHFRFGSTYSHTYEEVMNIRRQSELYYYKKNYGNFAEKLVKILDDNVYIFRA